LRAFWDELSLAIIRHGGSLARLVKDILDQAFPLPVRGRVRSHASHSAGTNLAARDAKRHRAAPNPAT
jgi:hypothetical protein